MMIHLDAKYDWYDIVLTWNKFRCMKKMQRRLSRRYGEKISIEDLTRDFKIVRSWWRKAVREQTYTEHIAGCFIGAEDVGTFIGEYRRKKSGTR